MVIYSIKKLGLTVGYLMPYVHVGGCRRRNLGDTKRVVAEASLLLGAAAQAYSGAVRNARTRHSGLLAAEVVARR